MNTDATKEERPRLRSRPDLMVYGLVVVVLLLVGWNLLPLLSQSRRSPIVAILFHVKRLDLAKQQWAADHKATNGTPVSGTDLRPYLGADSNATNLFPQVLSELYVPNPIGAPAHAQLQKGYRALPKMSLLRWGTNNNREIWVPTPQGGMTQWQKGT